VYPKSHLQLYSDQGGQLRHFLVVVSVVHRVRFKYNERIASPVNGFRNAKSPGFRRNGRPPILSSGWSERGPREPVSKAADVSNQV
jgi:hypothetical protein